MRLGIIAGNNLFPILFSQCARSDKAQTELIAICFHGETNHRISCLVDKAFWIHVGQFDKLLKIIKEEKIKHLVMAGQISPRRIFQRKYWDQTMLKLARDTEDFRPHTVLSHIVKLLESQGVEFLDSTFYLKSHLAQSGLMNGVELIAGLGADIDFGVRLISRFVELDVGQTIVVKQKTAIALEGFDGQKFASLAELNLIK